MGAAFQTGHHGAQTLLEPETGILGSKTHSGEVRRVAQELPKGNGESQKIVEQQCHGQTTRGSSRRRGVWLATDEEWVLPWGPRGASEVGGEHSSPARDGPAGVEKGSPGQPAPLCPERRPGRPDLRKSASGGCPVRHASPPRRASLAPHCHFLEALAQASLAEPTGPRGTGRHPLQEFPFQREEAFLRVPGAARGWGVLTARRPSSPPKAESERAWGRARLQRRHRSSRACLALRCVPPGPLASGAGGGPTRGASCLELRRRWAGAAPGAPWCRDSPENGRRGQSMVLMAGVSPRWGPPQEKQSEGLRGTLEGQRWAGGGGGGGRWP